MLCLNYAFLSFDLQPYQVDSKVSLISEVNSNRPILRKKIVALRAVTMREATLSKCENASLLGL